MIYVDTSVILAHVLTETLRPDPSLWQERLVSSRLLEYEVWTRLNRSRVPNQIAESARESLARIAFVELSPQVLARALEPFAAPVRTLDALHLATIEYLRSKNQPLSLVAYDDRLVSAARRLKVPITKF